MNNTATEMKTTLEGINSRITVAVGGLWSGWHFIGCSRKGLSKNEILQLKFE